MTHVNRLCLVIGFAVCAGAWAIAQDLAVYPSAVRIDSGADAQRVVAVQTRTDDVTLDVTGEVAVSFEPAGIAEWGDDHRVRGVADGQTTMTVTLGDKSVAVPIEVFNAGVTPQTSFRNDVEPVLMRAGCNTGKCHGSARGKNGFRLSLFGYDPAMDYTHLTRELRGRRMNVANPDESLMLLKPAGAVDHEGGDRFKPGDPYYETLKKWITEGALDDPAEIPSLTGIEILPKYALLEGEGAAQQFVVRAVYSDGTDRDVTALAILESSDGQVLAVDEQGRAAAGSRGEVYLMARYGSFAVVAQVIVIPAGESFEWPAIEPRNYIDEFVYAKLKKLRIAPAEPCPDEVYVRRVYLDILGKLPMLDEARAFLADTAADKRDRLVERLLERPEFPELWAMKWAEVLGVKTTNTLDRKGMHRYNDWLRNSFTENRPLDEIVRELLSAQGGNFTSPAANYYLVESEPTKIAENVAQVFFGIRIQCAQCHNHPFERWTMDDYYSFSAFFAQVGRKASSDPREQIVFDKQSGEVKNLRDGQVMRPKFLGGAEPDCSGRDRRAVLAEWLTAPENPWFAQNVANRVWAHFMGRGIVEPVDDVRVSNPPGNPQLIEALGKKLVENRYDLRALVRDICASNTYQQRTAPRNPDRADERNFAHAIVRRLPAEQLLDAIAQVTDTKVKFPNLPLGATAVQIADGQAGNYFLGLFGRPPRDSACTCERRGEPTLGQALHLINGDTVDNAIRDPNGRLASLLAQEKPPEAITEEIYLAAFCRPPTEDEKRTIVEYVASAEDPRLALEDALWSILNSKEFVFNH